MLCAAIHTQNTEKLNLDNASFEFINAVTGEILLAISLANASAAMICDSEYMEIVHKHANEENELDANYYEVSNLEPGRYRIKETVGPQLIVASEDISSDEGDNDQAYAIVQYKPINKDIVLIQDDMMQEFYLYHHDSNTTYVDANGNVLTDTERHGFKALVRSLFFYATHPKEFRAMWDTTFDRTHILTDDEQRRIVELYALSSVCFALAYFWIVAPFICLLFLSLKAIPIAGFGPAFLIGNISAYISNYILDGWSAYSLLSSAYPDLALNFTQTLLILALFVLGIVFIGRYFAKFFKQINPILDEQPPRLENDPNSGAKGASRFIDDEKEIAKNLKLASYDEEVLEDAGAYVGYLGKSPTREFVDCCFNQTLHATEAVINSPAKLIKSDNEDTQAKQFHFPEELYAKPKGYAVYLPGDYHTMVEADTRGGKSQLIVLPQIELLSRCPKKSLIILDSKRELFGMCGERLSELMPVYVIDMSNPYASSLWNPLAPAIELWNQGRINASNQAVTEVVEAIIPRQQNEGQSKFFNDGARSQTRSSSLYVISDPKCPDNQRTISTAARLIETFGQPTKVNPLGKSNEMFIPYEEMLEELDHAYDHPAYEAYSAARNAIAKEAKSFASTTATYLSLFRDPAIEEMMSGNDIPFSKIADERCAVFITIPTHKKAYLPFATLYLDQAYSQLVEHAQSGTGRCKQDVHFICDEICTINKWDKLGSALNYGAGLGIFFHLYVQNLSTFEAKYGDEAAGIYSACINRVFLKTGDQKRGAKEISDAVGSYTYDQVNTTYSGSRFLPMLHKSVSHSPGERKLLREDEALRWKAAYGAIVRNGDLPYKIPVPPPSRTPVSKIFGLGDLKYNLNKILKASLDRPVRKSQIDQKYSPELKKLKDGYIYSDKERRAARSRFIATLAKAYSRRINDVSALPDSDENDNPIPKAAIFNTKTGESQLWETVTPAFAREAHKEFVKWKIDNKEKDLKKWIANEQRAFKDGKYSDAPSLTNKASPPPKRKRKTQAASPNSLDQLEINFSDDANK